MIVPPVVLVKVVGDASWLVVFVVGAEINVVDVVAAVVPEIIASVAFVSLDSSVLSVVEVVSLNVFVSPENESVADGSEKIVCSSEVPVGAGLVCNSSPP